MRTLKLLVILFIAPMLLKAQDYNDVFRLGQQNNDFDARTLAMGNSSMGALGNFSSSILNPAGLATIKKNIFSFGINSNSFSNSVNFFDTQSELERRNGSIGQISIVLPLPVKRGSAVFAFGYNQVNDYNSILRFEGFNSSNNSLIQDLVAFNDDLAYELGLSYPVYDENEEYLGDETIINGNLNQRGKIVTDGKLNNWAISGAAEVAKNLYVGGTLNIISGDYQRNRNYYEEDIADTYEGLLDPDDPNTMDFETFYVNDVIDWDITGWDFRVGFLYKANKLLSFGANIKLPTNYTILEKYSIYGESDFSDTYFTYDSPGESFEYDVRTPMELSAGFSAGIPFFRFNMSAKYIDYSQMEFSDGFRKDELFNKNSEIEELFESSINWNLGGEFSLPYPALKIRGGFIYNPSPYIGDGTEFDKKYITAGLGFPIAKRLLFDFAYVHGWWKDFGDNYGVNISRTNQDITVDKMVLSLSYIFR